VLETDILPEKSKERKGRERKGSKSKNTSERAKESELGVQAQERCPDRNYQHKRAITLCAACKTQQQIWAFLMICTYTGAPPTFYHRQEIGGYDSNTGLSERENLKLQAQIGSDWQ